MVGNILFIGGSLNQTTMMHQIASQLREYDCYFSPFFADGYLGLITKTGLLDFTILGGRHFRNTCEYLKSQNLPVDYGGRSRKYDLVITGTDLIVPKNIRSQPMILVQEGMMLPENLPYRLVKQLKLPRYLADTAATGLSDAYDVFCVASPGYREAFIRKGVKPEKIIVTGIPNFDHVHSYLRNNFPYRKYVLVATSNARETFKRHDRAKLIHKARQIAQGRQLIFKLHPNENMSRAVEEIKQLAPGALIFTSGNTNHMVANCDVLITQYSSVTFLGLALGKQVFSELDLDEVRALLPIQNRGKSALRIAEVCRNMLNTPLREPKSSTPRLKFPLQLGQFD